MLRYAPALLLLAACFPAEEGVVGLYTADSTILELTPDGRALVMPRLTAFDPDTTRATIYRCTTRGDTAIVMLRRDALAMLEWSGRRRISTWSTSSATAVCVPSKLACTKYDRNR